MAEAIITHYSVGDWNVTYVMNILYQGKQWTIQRRYSDFVKFDKKLIEEGYVVGFVLPSKVVFGNFYPSVLEHRRKELNKYLRIIGSCLSSDNTYLREFFEVDENILKHALKKTRRLSDVYRSDYIRQIYKTASQLMLNGRAMRQHMNQRKKILKKTNTSIASSLPFSSTASHKSGSSMFSVHSRASSISSSPSDRGLKSLLQRSPPRCKGKSITNKQSKSSVSSCQEDSFSSLNGSLPKGNVDVSITREDFLTLSSLISTDYDNNENNECISPFLTDEEMNQNENDNNTSKQQQQQQQQHDKQQAAHISTVNSCFQHLSDDESLSEHSYHSMVIDIFSEKSLPDTTGMLTDMNDIAVLIKDHLTIPFMAEDIVINPLSKWKTEFINDAATRSIPPPRSPYQRPRGEESTVPLRLRFNKDDKGANLPPHMIKHLL